VHAWASPMTSVLSSCLQVSGDLEGPLDCYEESKFLMPMFVRSSGLDLDCYNSPFRLRWPKPVGHEFPDIL